jgi:hypothetical protein
MEPVSDTIWSRYFGGIENEWITDIAHAFDQRICIVGNKTQIEGNTRSLVKISNYDGYILNSNDFYSNSTNMVNSVFYSETDSSFISAGEFSNDVVTRACIYKWDLYANYICSSAINPIGNSHVGEAIPTNDGHFLLTGTYNNIAPGITSFFLSKSDSNCNSNSNIILGIEEQNSNNEYYNKSFPNPSSGSFSLRVDKAPELIELIDLTGKSIPFNSIMQGGILTIDAGSIAAGMYVLKFRTNQNAPITYQSIIITR